MPLQEMEDGDLLDSPRKVLQAVVIFGKGCVVLCALSFLFYGAPLSLWLVPALIAWLAVRKSEKLWAKALAVTLGSVIGGFLTVAVIYLVASVALPTNDTAPLARIEETVLWLDKHLSGDEKPKAWMVMGVLLGVSLVSYFVPKWDLVQRLTWLRKVVGQVGGVAAVAASFTFFTTEIAIPRTADSAYERLQVLWRDKKKEEGKLLAERVAYEELQKAVEALPPAKLTTYRAILASAASMGDQEQAAKLLEDFVDYHRPEARPAAAARKPEAMAGNEEARKAIMSAVPVPPKGDIVAAVTAQEERIGREKQKKTAAEEGVKEILSASFEAANDPIKEFAGEQAKKLGEHLTKVLAEHFARDLVETLLGPLTQTAASYLGELTGAALERAQEKEREALSEKLRFLGESVSGKDSAVSELEKAVIPRLAKLTADLESSMAKVKTDEAALEHRESAAKRFGMRVALEGEKDKLASTSEGLQELDRRLKLLEQGTHSEPTGERPPLAALFAQAEREIKAAEPIVSAVKTERASTKHGAALPNGTNEGAHDAEIKGQEHPVELPHEIVPHGVGHP